MTNSIVLSNIFKSGGNSFISTSNNFNSTFHTYDYVMDKIEKYPIIETKLTLEEQKKLLDLEFMNILLFRNCLTDELLEYACENSSFLLILYKMVDTLDRRFIEQNIIKNPSSIQYLKLSENKYYNDEKIRELAVSNDGSSIKFIDSPTENMINLALDQSYSSIFFIENPTREMQCRAIKSGFNNFHDIKYFLRRLSLTDEIFDDNNTLLELDDEIVTIYFRVFFEFICNSKEKLNILSKNKINVLSGIYYVPPINGFISLDFVKSDERLEKIYKLVKMEVKLKK